MIQYIHTKNNHFYELLSWKKNWKYIKGLIIKIEYESILNLISNIIDKISIVKPETLLKWQHQLVKSFRTFKSKKKKKGRPPVLYETKLLVLKIKNEILYWGA